MNLDKGPVARKRKIVVNNVTYEYQFMIPQTVRERLLDADGNYWVGWHVAVSIMLIIRNLATRKVHRLEVPCEKETSFFASPKVIRQLVLFIQTEGCLSYHHWQEVQHLLVIKPCNKLNAFVCNKLKRIY